MPVLGGSLAVVEYTGVFPGHIKHGNAKADATQYRRTAPETLEAIGRQTGIRPAKQVLQDLDSHCSPGRGPRNLNQVHSKMSAVRRQLKEAGNTASHCANLADGVINVMNMLQTDDFVQSVVADKTATPSVILYNFRQLVDIQQFCFGHQTSSVLTFDSTFNVTKGMFVTTSVYKNPCLLRTKSGEEPILLGPVFIHGRLTAESYGTFVHHLASKLRDCNLHELTVGSDDDAALR